jgi:tungstate transport system substrate-binding protein
MTLASMFRRRWLAATALSLSNGLAGLAALPAAAQPAAPFIVAASTTSTEQSGLFRHLLPLYRQATGVEVRVVALGTGQALDAARRGDADVVLVHDPVAEQRFVAEGFGLPRRPVMYNDFVIVGPKADPAGLAAAAGQDAAAALKRLGESGAPFVSRGDRSGTHAAELRFWQLAGVDIAAAKPAGYRECGCGMGPALNIAAATGAYALTDRGTWLNFRNRAEMAVLVEGDRRLFNPYGVIVVNPARHPHVKLERAQQFADWLVSPAGQAAISSYRINGEQLFFPGSGG